jgi:hypothetical protein
MGIDQERYEPERQGAGQRRPRAAAAATPDFPVSYSAAADPAVWISTQRAQACARTRRSRTAAIGMIARPARKSFVAFFLR